MKYANAPWNISPAPVESTAFTVILGIGSRFSIPDLKEVLEYDDII